MLDQCRGGGVRRPALVPLLWGSGVGMETCSHTWLIHVNVHRWRWVQHTCTPSIWAGPGYARGHGDADLLAIVLSKVQLYDGDIGHYQIIIEKTQATSQLLGGLKTG